VLDHPRRCTSLEPVLRSWSKEIEGLRRFASEQWDKANQLRKEEERSFERPLDIPLERAQKAEKLADEIEVKLHNLKVEGKV
jgi:hypothetical protein